MLGRKIINPAVNMARQHILKHTNPEGFISLSKLEGINNQSAKNRALLELGYIAEQQKWGNIIGYRKP